MTAMILHALVWNALFRQLAEVGGRLNHLHCLLLHATQVLQMNFLNFC